MKELGLSQGRGGDGARVVEMADSMLKGQEVGESAVHPRDFREASLTEIQSNWRVNVDVH